MAQVEFRTMTPEVLAAAPACPSPTMVRALRTAAIELGDKALCYRYELEGQLALGNLDTTELDLPRDTNLVSIISLHAEGKHLKPTSVRIMDRDILGWRDEVGFPTKYLRKQNTLNAIRLYPLPEDTLSLRGEIALKPTRIATGFEEHFLDRFYATIVDGALARLLVVPSAPWVNPDLGAYHKQLFEAAVDDARRVADADDMPKERLIRYGGV